MGFTGNAPGWSIKQGTDVTDIDFNLATKYIGDTSIEFKATAQATKIISDFIEVPLGVQFELTYVLRRVSGGAGGGFLANLEFYDAAQSLIGSGGTTTFTPSADDIWETSRSVQHSVTTIDNRTRYLRIVIGKNSVLATAFLLGAVDIRVSKRGFRVTKTADQTITAAGGLQVVSWDSVDFDYGQVFDITTTDAWDPKSDNTGSAHARKHIAAYVTLWQMHASVGYAAGADDAAFVGFYQNGAVRSVVHRRTYTNAIQSFHLSDIFFLQEDDTLDVRTDHDSASNKTIEGTDTGVSRFCGWELSP